MFLGTHTPRLDEKGRLILPAKFRDQLAPRPGGHPGPGALPLRVHRAPSSSACTSRCRQAPVASKQARDYLRVLPLRRLRRAARQAGAHHHPGQLRTYAGLDRECTVIGAGSRVEIWDAAAWAAYLSEQEPEFASTAEEVVPGLF